jgi:diaminopimelate decarboxylase
MENGVLGSDVHLLNDLQEGDLLVFANADAYDSPMSYSFRSGSSKL